MKIFTKDCCTRLLKFTSSEDVRDKYITGFENFNFEYLNTDNGINITSDIKLDAAKSDYENSIVIYEAFQNLDRVQANDKRLWVTLAHTYFFDYTKKRWNINSETSDNTITERFHFEGSSLETRMRNSISRLWWSVKITVDESRTDGYELTKLLWSKQDIFQNIVERSYGTYDSVVKGFLEFYSENLHLKENQLRSLFTGLNAVGGVQILAMQSITDIKEILNSLVNYYKFSKAA